MLAGAREPCPRIFGNGSAAARPLAVLRDFSEGGRLHLLGEGAQVGLRLVALENECRDLAFGIFTDAEVAVLPSGSERFPQRIKNSSGAFECAAVEGTDSPLETPRHLEARPLVHSW